MLYRICLMIGGLVAGASAILGAANPGAVSRLEAVHLAEIYTGVPVERVALTLKAGRALYRVELKGGIAVSVDPLHGRVTFVEGRSRERDYQWPGIRVVAHRGGVSLGPPENTLPAIAKAIEVGADLIEVDIRETADGELVLMHDRTVNRTTNGQGAVIELSSAAIAELEIQHAGSNVIRVPRLGEALALMKGRIDADLDFKEGDLSKLIQAVKDHEMEDHVTMHASWDRCEALSKLEPRIRIRPTVEHAEQVKDLVARLRPAMVNFDWHAVTEASVRTAHLSGCLAFVNCLGSADTDFYVREAIRIGADYIQSDRPDRVIEILKELGLRGEGPILGSAIGTPLRHPRLRYPLR